LVFVKINGCNKHWNDLPNQIANMWHNIVMTLALLLVLEGIMPFLNPSGFLKALRAISQMNEKQLRASGLVSMLVGILIMYMLNN